MTLKETAQYLKISLRQLYRYIGQEFNPLPVVYLSPASPRVVKAKLDEWVKDIEQRAGEDLQLEHLREDAEQAERE